MFKRVLLLLFSVIGCGMGIALTLKAGIGVAPYDAVCAGLSELLNMKMGNIVIILNFGLIFSQWLMKGKSFKPIEFLQLLVSLVLGCTINLGLYNIFGNLAITNYIVKLIIVVLGQIACAFFVCLSLELRVVSLPMESTCMVVAEKSNKSLGIIRQLVDIGCVVVALVLSVVGNGELTIREGSIISLVLFGPLLDMFRPFIIRMLEKANI